MYQNQLLEVPYHRQKRKNNRSFMKEIYKNLFIGSISDCKFFDTAIVHACKTCHRNILGYRNKLLKEDKNYLIYQNNDNNLYLNLVDMEREFLPEYTDPIMQTALQFIENHIKKTPVLIHCDQGMSRSPSIGLLYLAINEIIPNNNYASAKKEFEKLYPLFNPGNGITKYLQNNWDRLIMQK